MILSFRGWDAQSEAQRVTVHAMQVVMIAGSWGARGVAVAGSEDRTAGRC